MLPEITMSWALALTMGWKIHECVMSFTEKYHMTFPGWEPERMAKLDKLEEK